MSLTQQAELITLLARHQPMGLTSDQLYALLSLRQDSLFTDRLTLSTVLHDLHGRHHITTDPLTHQHSLVTPETDLCELACLEKELNPTPSATELALIAETAAELNTDLDFNLAEANAFESDLILMATQAGRMRPTLKIARKAEKIALLNRLSHSMNEEIKALFDDIRHDLMQLEAI